MPRITSIERTWLDLPFKEVPARNMIRENPHWSIVELCTVTLDSGHTGVGETLPFYTWGAVTDEAVERARGANPAEIMWDDGLGAGLQQACFDAVGKLVETPLWALLGARARDRAHVGWWAIDMPAADWILECEEAQRQGYTSFKSKARPWFDVEDQVAQLCEAVPAHFRIDLDFNDFALDPSVARRLCKSLERWPQIAVWESPIVQEDVAGNRELRQQLDVPIAQHAGRPQLATQLTQEMCDVFVLEGGAKNAIHCGEICAEFNRPFWLQLVGTDITATMALHVAAVQSHARWPAIACNHMYREQLIEETITVVNGLAEIPDRPGLGVTVKQDVVERYRIDPIEIPYPPPGLLLRLEWPTGAAYHFSHARQLWDEFQGGRLPAFIPGVNLVRVPDDGSSAWSDLHARARKGPVYD